MSGYGNGWRSRVNYKYYATCVIRVRVALYTLTYSIHLLLNLVGSFLVENKFDLYKINVYLGFIKVNLLKLLYLNQEIIFKIYFIWKIRKIHKRVRSVCRKALRVDLLKFAYMKNFMRFTLLGCLLFSVTSMQAQIKFGAKAGLNLSTMTLKNSGISIDPKTLVGFHVGVISEIPIEGNFVLQPALLYSSKGSKYSYYGEDVTISPGFLEIPVYAAYKFDLGNMKLLLDAGPYFAFGIGGKIKSGGESQSINFGSDDNADMKGFDFGLGLGAGLEITNFLISLNYEFGLTNLVPGTTDGSEAKSRVFGISVGYFFGKK